MLAKEKKVCYNIFAYLFSMAKMFVMAEGVKFMKKGIHPEVKDCKVTCVCGESFTTKSIKDEIHVEVCSKCHPFYTGEQSRTSRAGRVDKFNKKYGFDKKTEA